MTLVSFKPRQALNKAYRKQPLNRKDFDRFQQNLTEMLDQLNEAESEENAKNLLASFLKDTWYKEQHAINTKGRTDLVIHVEKTAKSAPGVLIETKRPGNKSEMPSASSLNAKAVHELILYYLRERIEHQNTEIKHLIVTDAYQWYLFDATDFEKHFYRNTSFRKKYENWKEGREVSSQTDHFYKEIAQPRLAEVEDQIPFTFADLNDLPKVEESKEKALISLYKLLSPVHLLKKAFSNDSNSLDKQFYQELLHIIGLEEVKDGGKKLIQRKAEGRREPGSLLENTMVILDEEDRLRRAPKLSSYGNTKEEQLFNVALELCITWMNRILFLKLLEAQLKQYHPKQSNYAFLHSKQIHDYDELNKLFFQVLARKPADRKTHIQKDYDRVPYLNSSLFDITALEDETIRISNLEDKLEIGLHPQTVLKDHAGKRLQGQQICLDYLLAFLDAYDFSADNGEEIQEENKTLINAAVLGLIFEKINGYKDGSFFTPGFITMYMAKETLRKAVLQKFNDHYKWNCPDFEELRDRIEDRKQANQLVNSLRICDPAVGSGHFLVSCLNELIAIKSDLGILSFRDGGRVKYYQIGIENDELIVEDEEAGELFAYHMNADGKAIRELQALQEALFHEKQTLIENCLFGVDINPNSVKICRLRLWIELLKHAYYTEESGYTELETLPNIDINIKVGNSLVSKYTLDADLKPALRSIKYSIKDYLSMVKDYHNAQGRSEKLALRTLIQGIRENFSSGLSQNDADYRKLKKAEAEFFQEFETNTLFALELDDKQQAKRETKRKKLQAQIEKLEAKVNEKLAGTQFKDSFEWRFEFPEVLDDEGNFVGFDVLIANPPYIRQEELKELKPFFQQRFDTYAGTADLYVYFVELGMNLLAPGGQFCYIFPNKWMRARYGAAMRNWILQYKISALIDFGDLPVFEEAITYPIVLSLENNKPEQHFQVAEPESLDFGGMSLEEYAEERWFEVDSKGLDSAGWSLVSLEVQALLDKLKDTGVPLGEYVNGKIYRGVLTGLNEAFVIDKETRDRLISEDANSAEVIKPFLAGKDVKRYRVNFRETYLILLPAGWTNKHRGESEPSEFLSARFPAIANYLSAFEKKAKKRWDKGDYWWELRPCDYYDKFAEEKIIVPSIVKAASYTLDSKAYYSNDKTSIIATSERFVLGLIGSKAIDFFIHQIASTKSGGFFEYKPMYVSALPIVRVDKSDKRKWQIKERINELVGIQLAKKEDNKNAELVEYDEEVDQLVYELYGLSEKEIAIVESHSS
ncbi:MAG: TaqI-like C-terminal specificity domain-containing protein [Bacteroidota bacterium]